MDFQSYLTFASAMRDRAWNDWKDGSSGWKDDRSSGWRSNNNSGGSSNGNGWSGSGDWQKPKPGWHGDKNGNSSGGRDGVWSSNGAKDAGGAAEKWPAGKPSWEDVEDGPTITGSAKLRLVRLRRKLEAPQTEALQQALKRKRDSHQKEALLEDPLLGPEILADVNTILEQDRWEGALSGPDWLKDWLENGADWGRALAEAPAPQGDAFYCQICWKSCHSDRDMEKHKGTKDHRKRQRTWAWRYGVPPEEVLDDSPESAKERAAPRAGASPEAKDPALAQGASKQAAKFLRDAERIRSSPAGAAKRRLLEYRNSLTAVQRNEIIRHIGLRKANDVENLQELQRHFPKEVGESLSQVRSEKASDAQDMDWICRESTFSWMSGFYWHPESTCLDQRGDKHSAFFCHLCESDSWNAEAFAQHAFTRRHAENSLRWAEQMGDMEFVSKCGRCPSASTSPLDHRSEFRDLDLEHRRDRSKPDPKVKPETSPPVGFKQVYRGDSGRTLSMPYVAVEVKADRSAYAVRLMTALNVGPKVKKDKYQRGRQDKKCTVDLSWCLYAKCWKSLAIPMQEAGPGEPVDFVVAVRWAEGDSAPWEEFDEHLKVQVPRAGEVAILHADMRECGSTQNRRSRSSCETWVDCKPILNFVGRFQVEAAGGVEEMRGTQRPIQFATEDVLMSFLLWVPDAKEPRPLFVFFHGDMPRGVAQCPLPGLADFVPTYGPALMVVDEKKWNHPVRDFVVVTPVCSEEVWWLRYPAVHDSTEYAESVEMCVRGILDLMYDLGLSQRERGACFAGQSMGAYMALEMARAMPEGTAAVFAGAPCFDASRLDHLAARLVNVPLWVLIGRNDTMCSFEEVASIALKMRELDCKCVRLTSVSIKGHSEVGKKLEKQELFNWLWDPLK